MKQNQFYFTCIFSLLTLALLSGFKPHERSIETVSAQLIGTWQLVNVIENPGEPIYQSEEELSLYRNYIQSKVENSPPITFTFNTNQQLLIQYPAKSVKEKTPKPQKHQWKVTENGDKLLLKGPEKKTETFKILTIDNNELELLGQNSFNGRFMFVFAKIK